MFHAVTPGNHFMLSSNSKNSRRLALLIATFSFLHQANAATDAQVLCPESLDVTETVSGLDVAWEGVVDGARRAHKLEAVRLYNGHPKEMGNLVPDSVLHEKGLQKTSWRFPASASENYWLACTYQNTNFLAVKKLAPEIKSCIVTEQLLPSGVVLKLKSVTCQ